MALRPPHVLGALLLAGCHNSKESDDSVGGWLGSGECPPRFVPTVAPTSVAGQLAVALGRPPQLMVGLGNDLIGERGDAGAFHLGAPVDVHYLYLVGLPGRGGWPDWNRNGGFIRRNVKATRSACQIPMFTLYGMAVEGEANLDILRDEAYMKAWWDGLALALDVLAEGEGPSLLHIEPDFWGFAQQGRPGRWPWQIPVLVSEVAPDCTDMPDNLQGMGRCIVHLSRTTSPETRIGFHASLWAGEPRAVGAFLVGLGARQTDLLFVETLDRDAGCFEARGEGCTRNDGLWYWDESNLTSPNFAEHFEKARILHETTELPLFWWQTPLGRPALVPGGTPGAYRDNRAHYFHAHPEELVAAGGLGVAFGAGATGQTTFDSDGGQLQTLVQEWASAPTPLP